MAGAGFIDHHGKTGVRCFRGHGGELTERVQRRKEDNKASSSRVKKRAASARPVDGGLAGLTGADDVDHPAGLQRSGYFAGQVAAKSGPLPSLCGVLAC